VECPRNVFKIRGERPIKGAFLLPSLSDILRRYYENKKFELGGFIINVVNQFQTL